MKPFGFVRNEEVDVEQPDVLHAGGAWTVAKGEPEDTEEEVDPMPFTTGADVERILGIAERWGMLYDTLATKNFSESQILAIMAMSAPAIL